MPARISTPPRTVVSADPSVPSQRRPTASEDIARQVAWAPSAAGPGGDLSVTEFRDGRGVSRAVVDLGATTGVGPAGGVRNGGCDVRLAAPIVLRSDAEGRTYTAHASIPLSAIDIAPLSADDFAGQVRGATMLEPWGKAGATSSVSVVGGNLELDAPVGAPGAWRVSPPIVFVELANGQKVSLRLMHSQIGRDDSALLRSQTDRSIDAMNTALAYDGQEVDAARAALGSAPTSERLEACLATLERHQTELQQMKDQRDAIDAGKGTVELAPTQYP